jgi:uncharacterized membrane protein YdjX (TVP38/TMEM64 family)
MNNSANHTDRTIARIGRWLKRNYLSLLTLMFVLAIVIGLFVFSRRYPDTIEDFESLGYLGAFLIALVTNATVILPFPGIVVLFSLGAAFNPLLIGLAGGVGGGIGEMTGYLAGYSGRGIWRDNRMYRSATTWLQRWGSVVIFIFAATPLPMDVIGIISGNLRFSVWKFLIASCLGKIVQYIALAYMGAWGWDAIVNKSWDTELLRIAGLAALLVIVVLLLALLLERWTWRRGR